MLVATAHELLRSGHSSYDKFYGPVGDLPLGVGLILSRVGYPLYLEEEENFATAEGMAYVVSHECDIDPDNDRPFNDRVLICPIIPLGDVIDIYLEDRTEDQTRSFIEALARQTVDRVAYIPEIADALPYGGILYFSALSSTHLLEVRREAVQMHCSVSGPGLQYVDHRLHQALLKRPKAVPLPLTS
jgi:hypothetical protein